MNEKNTAGVNLPASCRFEDTKGLYSRLAEELAAGRAAAVVSKYCRAAGDGSAAGPAEQGSPNSAAGLGNLRGDAVEKFLYSEGDAEAWAGLAAILAHPGARRDGPVTYMTGDAASRCALLTVENYLPKPRVVILGGGHIALALTKMAKLTDFSVTVFDDRPAFANPGRFPEADEVICDDFSRAMERVKVQASDYVVIVTRGHKHDTECLEGVLSGVRPAYTGMIGSRRRVYIVLRQLKEAGYPQELIDGVHTPIGLRIGAVTPAEISVSILAQIIQVKRSREDNSEALAAAPHGSEVNLACDAEIAEWLARHGDEADALITILDTKGSVPREAGAKMAISYEGRTAGTIGGGCAESDVMRDARTIIREGGWMTRSIDMTDSAEDDGMVCGGTMAVLIEKAQNHA
jgi:xanthine dehydrogenase accessory factor